MLKKSFIALLMVSGLCLGLFLWLKSLIPQPDQDFSQTQPGELRYLKQKPSQSRGKVLVVVTSSGIMGASGKATGYELTELARPYYVFLANGFGVDIASPQGGQPPVVIDRDDLGPFDYAFLNDPQAQYKVNYSIPIAQASAKDYQAIFFVGGKGTMFDFPNNTSIQVLVRDFYRSGKVIGAVCHGPAALVHVRMETGELLVAGRRISAFTNEEELFLIPDAEQHLPFLLEDRLRAQGAIMQPGPAYLEQVSVDGQLITGQNPWSTWQTVERMVEAMGYTPVPRQVTPAEYTVELLLAYEQGGFAQAAQKLQQLNSDQGTEIDRRLLAMHGVVAAMRWELGKTLDLLRLLRRSKK
ncbi:type 1 glutamine amidotransferase domain-containing protein [Microbulbifer discodermiae]|uniref:type 1 glutamine amidotransferase domain-containing protein n=1 Tax=Microbulbifer sp. 2201CG32-9 TaxID=3232309 RepID=UPI00345B50C5